MSHADLFGKDLITTQEWTLEELKTVLDYAKDLKNQYHTGTLPPILDRKTLFMLFYSSSTRTRCSFESAMTCLGGHAQMLSPDTMRLKEGEAIGDTGKMFDRYGHALGIRILEKAVGYIYGQGNKVLRDYAKACRIPVINMADDMYHPCQALTDIMTIQEKLPNYEGKKFVFSWAYSKHARSWCSVQEAILASTRFGMDTVLAYPEGFDIDPQVIEWCKQNAADAGQDFEITHDVKEAYKGAHVVYPRCWTSTACINVGMDKFGEANEQKLHDQHKDWICNQELMDLTARNSLYMHCLPVFRGEEATDEVVDGPHSVVIDEAENRLHTQMAIMALTMAGKL